MPSKSVHSPSSHFREDEISLKTPSVYKVVSSTLASPILLDMLVEELGDIDFANALLLFTE